MGGLAGVILKNGDRSKNDLSLITNSFEEMLIEADTRGGHATGFALIDKRGDFTICKKPKNAYSFLEDSNAQECLDLVYNDITCLMGHTRYATLGKPSINKNNHPIRAGNTIGTHNGSIHNHKELFEKYEMTRFAEVDSEAIFRLYETSKDIKDFALNRLPKVRGRVSIVWADVEYPEYIYMIKGNNPLEMVYVPRFDLYAYGSTQQIIKAGAWGKIEPIDIKPNTMLRVNTSTFKIRTKTIKFQKPFVRKHYKFNSSIGAYEKTPHVNKVVKNYDHTIKNFVPRFSFKDQMSLFKKIKANDGSTIKKVR